MKESHDGLDFIEKLIYVKTGKSLNNIQKAVLQQFWQDSRKTYEEFAKELEYSASYIQQTVAPQLWRLLSEILGEKVSKINFRSIVERQWLNQVLSKSDNLIEPPMLELMDLEFPEGRVSLSSPFYIERVPHESRCYAEIVKPGAFIHIQAPKQMGKTSLLGRILAYATRLGYQTASLNLHRADQSILTNLDKLLRWFAWEVSHKLKLNPKLDDYWYEDLGSKASCTNYFQDYLLEQINCPFFLAMDEVNEIFQNPQIAQDFLSLLRSWHEESKDNKIWQKLRLVVVNCTEAYVSLNINKSPFKVGIQIQLDSFTWEQVQDVAQRHRLDLSIDDLAQLMWLVAGHPYLLRLALYHLAQESLTLEELLQTAASDTGIYSEHLHQKSWYLQQNSELAAAFEKVLKAKAPIELEQVQAFKLHSIGLVKMEDKLAMTSCNLYQQYFGDRS
ncbi:AAA-like domain-containing protein [Microcoleus sp. FACHB-53]|nr:AAA-like domain-containing protein [Microcoleus sp. FACHB-53]